MAISIFPSTAAEFVSNNFVVDMNDTSNNTADTGGVKQAGPYSMSFSSGDASFDVYLIDEDGNSVGYSNSTSITASGLFTSVVILGVANDEIITFNYSGSVNNADGEGDEPGAGAYLESISPSDLPTIDDTATVVGGNFGADTEIKFESGATVLDAKNITVNNSTELLVTRPDNLDADLDPWTVRAITTGVPEPTGTNANILTDAVTAGATPVWVTTSPLALGEIDVAYSDTLEATDADGAVTYTITAGTLPTGLSLDSSTGVISGTPTTAGETFTVQVTDDGGNTNSREFALPIQAATGGTIATTANGLVTHTFTTDGDFVPLTTLEADYLIVAGGGGGGATNASGGGGGAGGLLQGTNTFTAGTYTATIGNGGTAANSNNALGNNGNDSNFISLTAIGGGAGGSSNNSPVPNDGGSGGGADYTRNAGGAGTAGQGFAGGGKSVPGGGNVPAAGGGGGGASEIGGTSDSLSAGGDGIQWVDGEFYAGGGGGGYEDGNRGFNYFAPGGAGGGGRGGRGSISGIGNVTAENGTDGKGGGGGGLTQFGGGAGGNGVVVVAY